MNRKIPANMFIQRAFLQLDSLNDETSVHIVFGINDNLTKRFDDDNDSTWTIMNQSWTEFSRRYGISTHDLWSSSQNRTLSNAKLFPIFSLGLSKDEMTHLSHYFWLELIESSTLINATTLAKWKQSVRLSLEEIESHVNLEKILSNRRGLFNLASTRSLVDSIVNNTPIPFASLIRNAVRDGYAHHMLNLLDEGRI